MIRTLERRRRNAAEAARIVPARPAWVYGLAGFDPQLASRVGRRHQARIREIAVATAVASALAGVAAYVAAWLAFASGLGAAFAGVAVALFSWNLLRLANAGSAYGLAQTRPQTAQQRARFEEWRPHRVSLVILATLGAVLAQPLLVVLSTQWPGGSVETARHALVELRREVVEDAHEAKLDQAKAELRSASTEAKRLEAERAGAPAVGAEAYSPAALDRARREREVHDRIASLRDRIDTMSVVGPAYVTDLVPYAYHVERSTLFTHRLGFVWSRPQLAVGGTVLFAALMSSPLLLRFSSRSSLSEYLHVRRDLERALVDEDHKATRARADAQLAAERAAWSRYPHAPTRSHQDPPFDEVPEPPLRPAAGDPRVVPRSPAEILAALPPTG